MPTTITTIPTPPAIDGLLSTGFRHLRDIIHEEIKKIQPFHLARIELDGRMPRNTNRVYFNGISVLRYNDTALGSVEVEGIRVWTRYHAPFCSLDEDTHQHSVRHSQSEGLFVPFELMQEDPSTQEVPAAYLYKLARF